MRSLLRRGLGSAFQSLTRDSNHSNLGARQGLSGILRFQSLTRDSNHSNLLGHGDFLLVDEFQSLTRDSNHSNARPARARGGGVRFNPSRGIAIIQTRVRRFALF